MACFYVNTSSVIYKSTDDIMSNLSRISISRVFRAVNTARGRGRRRGTALVLTISAGCNDILSTFIGALHLSRTHARVARVWVTYYATNTLAGPHECNAVAAAAAATVRSTARTHTSAHALTHARTRGRATCIHKVPDIWRARARDSPPPPPSLYLDVATLPGLAHPSLSLRGMFLY